MDKNVLGVYSKVYHCSEEVRALYYKCTAQAVEPRVTEIYAKFTQDGELIVYGTYEVLIVFIYNIRKDEPECFARKVILTFAEIMPDKTAKSACESCGLSNVTLKAELKPHAELRQDKKGSFLWRLEVDGIVTVTMLSSGEDSEFGGTSGQPENSDTSAGAEKYVGTQAGGQARRILNTTGVDVQTLLDLPAKEREHYLE